MLECVHPDRLVKIRKDRQCFACLEIFPKGTEMIMGVYKDEYIYNLYKCQECKELMIEHTSEIADYDGIFWEGCVAEWKREAENE